MRNVISKSRNKMVSAQSAVLLVKGTKIFLQIVKTWLSGLSFF